MTRGGSGFTDILKISGLSSSQQLQKWAGRMEDGAYNLDQEWVANRIGSDLTNKFLSHIQDCGCESKSSPTATCLYPGIPMPSPLYLCLSQPSTALCLS